MRCSKMKIVGLLFILTNSLYFSFSLSVSNVETKSVEFKDFGEVCPVFWSSIKVAVEKYATNCTDSTPGFVKKKELYFHQEICLLVNGLLESICRKSANTTVNNFFENTSINDRNICPLNITVFHNDGKPAFEQLTVKLRNVKYCTGLCYDFSEVERQCVVLVQVYEHFIKMNESVLLEEGRTVNRMMETVPSVSKTLPSDLTKKEATTLVAPMLHNTDNSQVQKKPKAILLQKAEIHYEDKTKDIESNHLLNIVNKTIEFSKKGVSKSSKNNKIDSNQMVELNNVDIKQKTNSPIILTSTREHSTTGSNTDTFEGREFEEQVGQDENFSTNIKQSYINGDSNIVKSEPDYKKDNSSDYDSIKTYFPDTTIRNAINNHIVDVQIGKQVPVKDNVIGRVSNRNDFYSGEGFFQTEDSHFFIYFLMFTSAVIIGYLAFHNKNKILAYALEGRSDRRNRRRPNSANYRKLESNLEEAIASNPTQSSASSIVY